MRCLGQMCPIIHSCLDLKFFYKPAHVRQKKAELAHFKFIEDAVVGFAAGHFLLLVESFKQLSTLFLIEASRMVI